ncbi:transposase [Ktedonobacter sp. SOSP1-52]|uniref:IS200/IS605 family element RNA-guided endonuclease TnpB n=1 Tax=Ktedonobacter sp. SOSP1-52 TaxID=2778366 RepID=UPI001916C4DA|nr:IS200/IS605 family element RNA-guided endonuclease TnpB [Ktedonobacter sp. SOSP1-52]GHO61720.1 transposase [Ktedonobacter sp. SOSP1-52]
MVKKAYKYRFYPTDEQARHLAQTFGCCRFVYNYALSTKKHAYFDHKRKIKTSELSVAITALKKEEGTAWLKDVSSVPLQQSLRHLDAAYKNFFEGRAKYPTFKKKHKGQSATYTDNAFTWRGGKLTLAKQKDPLNIVWSRPLPKDTRISSVTISKDPSGRYFISLLVEEWIEPLPLTEKVVGVDLGLKSLLIPSDGKTIANPKHLHSYEKKLAKAQRRHAKKKKGSKNRDKARKKVARLHAKIVNTRRDYQHKVTTRLIRENQVICLEDLHVAGMLKNHCLAKAISDVGWGEIRRQLEYKAAWYGRTVVIIDRWEATSKTCSACGYNLDILTLDVREWVCPGCGVCHDRDINAAYNILAAGLAVVSACGENVRPVTSKGA